MRHSVGSEYHKQDWNIEQVSDTYEILGFAAMVGVLTLIAGVFIAAWIL